MSVRENNHGDDHFGARVPITDVDIPDADIRKTGEGAGVIRLEDILHLNKLLGVVRVAVPASYIETATCGFVGYG